MKLKYTIYALFISIASISIISCSKIDNYLDKKNKISDVTPSTLNDFRAILNNTNRLNSQYSTIGLIGTDNVYLTDQAYRQLYYDQNRNAYTWSKNLFNSEESYDWDYAYQRIGQCNIILDGLKNIGRNSNNKISYNEIKGEALYFRAYNYYMLAQIFCKPYIAESATTDLGLVLRESSDVTEKSVRATVAETYQLIISDTKDATSLLSTPIQYQTRPSKPAANALLAKAYLSMGDYDSALVYATACLNDYNTLIDYNDSNLVSESKTYRFPPFPGNEEVILYLGGSGNLVVAASTSNLGKVDTEFYNSYNGNDLRKSLFFINNGNGDVQFRGSYTGSHLNFCGIATNEVYLIKAECEVRLGNIMGALADLNTLLVKRYKTGTFKEINVNNKDALLKIILNERRKELPFTGQTRWEDLRRLNQDPRFAITLHHIIDGTDYTLPPNDDKYTFPIPDNEIQISHLQQNDR